MRAIGRKDANIALEYRRVKCGIGGGDYIVADDEDTYGLLPDSQTLLLPKNMG